MDTSRTITLKENSNEAIRRLLPLSMIGGGMALLAWLQSDQPALFRIVTAVVAFCLIAVAAVDVVRLLRRQYRTLILAPGGFQDTDIAPEFVPWSAVESLDVANTHFRGRQQLIAVELKIKDAGWIGLTLSRSARLNKHHSGVMWLTPVGDGTDFHTFLTIVQSYARDHGDNVGRVVDRRGN